LTADVGFLTQLWGSRCFTFISTAKETETNSGPVDSGQDRREVYPDPDNQELY